MSERRRRHPTDEANFRGDTQGEEQPIEQLDSTDSGVPTGPSYVPEKPSHYKVSRTGEVSRMPMLDPSEWGISEAVEPYALKDGTEARLLITEAELRTSDTGQYALVRFDVEGEPYAKSITKVIGIPDRGKQTAKQFNDSAYYMGLFLACFDIDSSGPMAVEDDWPGHSGWCILSKTEDSQYGEQNKIAKMIAPR